MFPLPWERQFDLQRQPTQRKVAVWNTCGLLMTNELHRVGGRETRIALPDL